MDSTIVTMGWGTVLPQWLTALGTVLAVFIALFQKPFRDWYNRPKIEMTYSDNKQCKVEVNSSESSDSSKQIRIRIKLVNKGNYIATHAALYVDSYYKNRGDGSFVKIETTPKQLRDYRNAKPSSIAPHLQYYFEVAVVNKYESMTTQDENGNAKQFYKLYLSGEGVFSELGRGTFIIPLKFYSSRINVKIAYLKLFWDSDVYTLDKQYFSVEMLSEKEFKKIQIA